MAKKKTVLAFVGSPRKGGNCDTLCDRVLAGARSAGASVEKYYLYDMEIRPCDACDACRKRGRGECGKDDAMRPLYPKIKSCDALVLASPIYWMMVSGMTKLFLDRLYPLAEEKRTFLKAKRAVVCLTYGADDVLLSGCDVTARALNDIFTYLKVPASIVHASAWHKGDILKNRAALKRAYEAGKAMVK